jgi:hypothetical protein
MDPFASLAFHRIAKCEPSLNLTKFTHRQEREEAQSLYSDESTVSREKGREFAGEADRRLSKRGLDSLLMAI